MNSTPTHEVYLAYRDMFDYFIGGNQLWMIVTLYFPFLDSIVPSKRARVIRKSRKVINTLGKRLIEAKKTAMAFSCDVPGKDLLTLLLKSNVSKDVPVNMRLGDDELLDQINTFLFAGSDTTALALTWALYHLAEEPHIQERLRGELLAAEATHGSACTRWLVIEELPFLENVVREALRLVPPVHSTLRVAMRDAVIPLGSPMRTRSGEERWKVRIRKGQMIHVPIEGANVEIGVWGLDAWDFNPDRWDHLPEAALRQPGVYSHLMTFSTGPRACLGQKFSIMEIKTIIYVLLITFEFSCPEKVFKANLALTRPYVGDSFDDCSRCPLHVSRLSHPHERGLFSF